MSGSHTAPQLGSQDSQASFSFAFQYVEYKFKSTTVVGPCCSCCGRMICWSQAIKQIVSASNNLTWHSKHTLSYCAIFFCTKNICFLVCLSTFHGFTFVQDERWWRVSPLSPLHSTLPSFVCAYVSFFLYRQELCTNVVRSEEIKNVLYIPQPFKDSVVLWHNIHSFIFSWFQERIVGHPGLPVSIVLLVAVDGFLGRLFEEPVLADGGVGLGEGLGLMLGFLTGRTQSNFFRMGRSSLQHYCENQLMYSWHFIYFPSQRM